MKAAFTVWNDRIAPVFDVAREIHVVQSEAGNIVAQSRVNLDHNMPAFKAQQLAEMGVQMLICGAISRHAQSMVTARGIKLSAFIKGDLKTVIEAWQRRRLDANFLRMPGCKNTVKNSCRFNNALTKELKMRNNQGGGRYQMREGKGRGKGSSGKGQCRQRSGQSQASVMNDLCTCTKCGHQESHQQGIPCMSKKCPKCGGLMTRQ